MTIISYIFTYYAIAFAIPLTLGKLPFMTNSQAGANLVPSLANHVLIGMFTDEIEQYYITSWKIFFGMAVVFNVLSPLAYAMLRHRLGQKTFFVCLWETNKRTPKIRFCRRLFLHVCS